MEVSPTRLDVVAPAEAGALTITALSPAPVRIQVRVFAWSQPRGEDVLQPTDSVVPSPPAVVVRPGQPYTLRIVRRGAAPAREEAYRVFVDEIPDASQAGGGRVNIALRLNIPVFFTPPSAPAHQLSFAIAGGHLVVTNAGGRSVRFSDLAIRDARGRSGLIGKGLNGYVLAGSTRRFPLGAAARSVARGATSVTASTDRGPLNARVGSGR